MPHHMVHCGRQPSAPIKKEFHVRRPVSAPRKTPTVVDNAIHYVRNSEPMVHIITGDSRALLKHLPDNSINCCVTSPPYFGLRDYGTASWTGGDVQCDHQEFLGVHGAASSKQVTSAGTQKYNYRDACKKCGAQRTDSQIGLEKTPELYVTELVELLREVHRVLRNDGTLWLNLGDSYARAPGKGQHKPGDAGKQNYIIERGNGRAANTGMSGLPDKNLLGIPWRVAFALQQDGWYLRQDIIWHKPNPMPESVQDRCTKAHEYIFLLSKSPKYFFDSKAMQEPATHAGKKVSLGKKSMSRGQAAGANVAASGNGLAETYTVVETRNRRSVWTVSTKPFKEAHFATFPADLIEPCILAGCPEGGIVLDPFGGAGTTGLVAQKHNRRAVLFELNPGYAEMARRRCAVGS